MKTLHGLGLVLFASCGAPALACDLDGLPGGRFSPFYALAHSAPGQGSVDGPDQSSRSRSDSRAGDSWSSEDADQPSQSGVTPDGDSSPTGYSPSDGNPSEKVTG